MNPQVLRLIDANANRAREGLRVLEDHARFVLDDAGLSGALKGLRHDLTTALAPLLPDAILCRDTAGDVGTANKTDSEARRESLADVVTAAGKRLGEALRAIEEYAKIEAPTAAPQVESFRYRFYDIETRLARTLRPTSRLDDVRLCVLITESACAGDWFDTARQAIEGGADMLQLREKELEAGELLRRAKRFVELCRSANVISIINDRPDVALLAGADGVHVGQGDLPAIEARKLIGAGRILGVSTHHIDHAKQALLDGADYLGVGPVFPSPTKPRDILPGLAYAEQVAEQIRLPAFAIAGITQENLPQVLATGVRRIAVTAAVTSAADPAVATRQLLEKLRTGEPGTSAMVGKALLPAIASVSGGRRLPHWQMPAATYFLTYRLNIPAEFTQAERKLLLDHLIAGDARFYDLDAAVIMPDHVHLLLRTRDDLAVTLRGIKGVSARTLNKSRATSGPVWQDESFDRIVRDQAEFDEKLQDMYLNPVRRGLVDDPEKWDAWYYRATGASGR